MIQIVLEDSRPANYIVHTQLCYILARQQYNNLILAIT